MEILRKELLKEALEFNRGFLQENSDDPDVRSETARAHVRMGEILLLL